MASRRRSGFSNKRDAAGRRHDGTYIFGARFAGIREGDGAREGAWASNARPYSLRETTGKSVIATCPYGKAEIFCGRVLRGMC